MILLRKIVELKWDYVGGIIGALMNTDSNQKFIIITSIMESMKKDGL
jgi:hypothetical protein